MGANDVLEIPGFNQMEEENQIKLLQSGSDSFRQAYDQNPEGALAKLREFTGKEPRNTSPVGEVIRNFGSGLGESFADLAQLPFEAAEYAASAMGSDWQTNIDEAIESASQHYFPEAESDLGNIAREAGYGAGLGAMIFLGGTAVAATRIPGLANLAAKLTAAEKVSVGLGAEVLGGGVGAGAAEATMQHTDNTWAAIGAGILAGGGAAIAASYRGVVRRGKMLNELGEGEKVDLNKVLGEPGYTMPVSPAARQRADWDEALGGAQSADEIAEGRPREIDQWTGAHQKAARQMSNAEARRALNPEMWDEALGGAQPPGPRGPGPRSASAERTAEDAASYATTEQWEEYIKMRVRGSPDPNRAQRILNVAQTQFADQAWEQQAMDSLIDALGETEALFTPNFIARLAGPATAVLRKAGVPRDNTKTMVSQLLDVYAADLLPANEIDDLMTAAGLSIDELVDAFKMTPTEHGRGLNVLSQEAKKLRKSGKKLTTKEIRQFGGFGLLEGRGFWKRAENIRRGLLVTQLATAARNFETQVVNMGVHGLADSLDWAMLRLFRFDSEALAQHPVVPFSMLTRFLTSPKQSWKDVKAVEKHFINNEDDLMKRLTSHYSSDVEGMIGGGGVMGSFEKGTQIANTLNRFQEYAIRRVAFTDELDRIITARTARGNTMTATGISPAIRGKGLHDIVKEGNIKKIRRDDIEAAINKALDVTWGQDFKPVGGSRMENLAGSFISTVNNFHAGPFHATQIMPFPRFMMNAMKYQFNFSPLGVSRYFSPGGLARWRSGDTRPLSEALVGTAGLLTAYQHRKSQADDTSWNEFRIPDAMANFLGKDPDDVWDARPFNPFSSYLFAADVAHRMVTGRLDTLTTRDIAMGFLSTNMRAGAGLYMLDKALDTFADNFQSVDGARELAEIIGIEDASTLEPSMLAGAGEFLTTAWSGMLVPFQQLHDLAAGFDEMMGTDESTVKDASANWVGGPFARKIPYAGENLPDVELPTREAAPRTEAPWLRQMTGATIRGKKNDGEKALDRLGFTRGEILPSTGDNEFDRLRAKYMGPLFERTIIPLVRGWEGKDIPRDLQREQLSRALKSVRRAATLQASREVPGRFKKQQLSKLPSNIKRILRNRPEVEPVGKGRVRERSKRMEDRRKKND